MAGEEAGLKCPWCASPAQPADSQCPSCGASLLVDLVPREQAALDERTRFRAAKVLAELGSPAPGFVEAKTRLSSPGAALVPRVHRVFAESAAKKLEEVGVQTTLRPWLPDKPKASRWPVAVGLSLLLGLGGLGAGIFYARRPVPAHAPQAPAPAAPGEPQPVEAAAETRREAVPTGPSEAEVGKKALASVATVTCEGSIGAGFFVEPDLLVTNAHVVCAKEGLVTVKTQDGRTLLGKVAWRDDWLDLARVEVAGAAATPLPIGDSTRLEPGEWVTFVGAPRGLEFTLHEGKVSATGRNYLGLGYVQLNATVNPGNSGGPLVNRRGEAVGVVSLKVARAEGIGLALPLEYLKAPAEPEAAARWSKMLERVKQADEGERARVREVYREPHLVALTQHVDLPVAILLGRFGSTPHRTSHRFRFTSAVAGSCILGGDVEEWAQPKESDDGVARSREARWLLRTSAGGGGLYVGAVRLRSRDCEAHQVGAEGTLALLSDGDARPRGEVEVHPGALLRVDGVRQPAVRSAEPRGVVVDRPASPAERRATEEQDAREFERTWRAKFREAKAAIARLEERCKQARRVVEDLDGKVLSGAYELTPAGIAKYEEAKRTVRDCVTDKAQLEEALQDLERQASHQSVPREWR